MVLVFWDMNYEWVFLSNTTEGSSQSEGEPLNAVEVTRRAATGRSTASMEERNVLTSIHR
jgi:hypothetical protein